MLLHGKRIFIVEDDLANRAIAQMLLEGEGAKIGIDRWGVETVKRLQNFVPVDLILLDIMFPQGVTGYDVFDRIRALPEFDDVPIVAVSAADTATEIPKAREKGFRGFICKPIDFKMFPHQIAAILNGEVIWQMQ